MGKIFVAHCRCGNEEVVESHIGHEGMECKLCHRGFFNTTEEDDGEPIMIGLLESSLPGKKYRAIAINDTRICGVDAGGWRVVESWPVTDRTKGVIGELFPCTACARKNALLRRARPLIAHCTMDPSLLAEIDEEVTG